MFLVSGFLLTMGSSLFFLLLVCRGSSFPAPPMAAFDFQFPNTKIPLVFFFFFLQIFVNIFLFAQKGVWSCFFFFVLLLRCHCLWFSGAGWDCGVGKMQMIIGFYWGFFYGGRLGGWKGGEMGGS